MKQSQPIRFDEGEQTPKEDKGWAVMELPSESESQLEKFVEITEEMAATYEQKNEDYGDAYSDGFKRFGATQLVSRIYEKYCRVEHLLCHNAENKVKDEYVKDTLTDMATQCIILRMLLESEED